MTSATPFSLDRRRLLKLAAACAAGVAWPRRVLAQPRFAADPFALGIASGSPSHDSVVLWTRLAAARGATLGPDPIGVRWELARDASFSRIVRSGETTAVPELAHSVHVEVGGLAPDHWYFFRFMAGDAQSASGLTRTFPAPDARPPRLRLAYASCQRWEHGYFGAYRHMRDENLDAVLFVGDYIYEYPTASNAVRPPPGRFALRLDDYRRRYALYKSDVDLQTMHAQCPWLVVWDDHEVQNDYAGPNPGNGGPAVADFPARRAAAYQAYYEHMPLRASTLTRALSGLTSGAETRVYGEVRYGDLATFYLTDDRQYRDRQPCTKGGQPGSSVVDAATCADWPNPARTLLGAEQERWLDDAFARGGKGWNIVAMQTLFGRRGLRSSFWNDGWDGYPAARERMIASMRRHALANCVLLGGDIHSNWVGHVKADYADPASAAIGVEFCGTSISARDDPKAPVAAWLAENPHFVLGDGTHRGYGVVELTPTALTTSLRVVDDVTRRDPTIATLARFSVAAGRPVLERD